MLLSVRKYIAPLLPGFKTLPAGILLILITLGLSGCSSIPLSTMVRMSQFGTEEFAALEAEQLRAKVTVERHIGLKPELSKLTVSLNGENGELSREFDFELDSLRHFEIDTWFSAPTEWSAYHLKLTDKGIESFQALQAFVAEDPSLEQFALGVSAKVKNPPPEGETIILSIALRLAENEEYMVLFDNAEVRMGKTEM